MKKYIAAVILLFAALFAGLPSHALADFSDEEVLNKLPTLSPEQMSQVPFAAHIDGDNPGFPLDVDIHNPFRDKTIYGIVVNVTGKDPASGQAINIDLFIRVQAGLLKSGWNSITFFGSSTLNKPESHTVITLKEIHYSPASPAPASKAPPAKTKSTEKRTAAN